MKNTTAAFTLTVVAVIAGVFAGCDPQQVSLYPNNGNWILVRDASVEVTVNYMLNREGQPLAPINSPTEIGFEQVPTRPDGTRVVELPSADELTSAVTFSVREDTPHGGTVTFTPPLNGELPAIYMHRQYDYVHYWETGPSEYDYWYGISGNLLTNPVGAINPYVPELLGDSPGGLLGCWGDEWVRWWITRDNLSNGPWRLYKGYGVQFLLGGYEPAPGSCADGLNRLKADLLADRLPEDNFWMQLKRMGVFHEGLEGLEFLQAVYITVAYTLVGR